MSSLAAETSPTASRPKLKSAPTEYGILEERNIDRVLFGNYDFNTWYGNSAYFFSRGDSELGIDTYSKNNLLKRRTATPSNDTYWLLRLHVCEYCFKYTSDQLKMVQHRTVCELARPFPPLGRLLYSDPKACYLIKKIRGFRHELFCQNLSLFGKLFLNDKSVYYNVQAFDFYVVYGCDSHDEPPRTLHKQYKPMGFFSKEINSWEADNNLACICIFPPFQRLGLGLLLIEFLYALAAVTPGQTWLGPEFPLSPYGQVAYLRLWSRRLAFVLANDISKPTVTLPELACRTGFRKDDILFTIEYMGIMQEQTDGSFSVLMLNLKSWCTAHNVSTSTLSTVLNELCLLL